MAWEFTILHLIQNFRTPWMDQCMLWITHLGDKGQFWVLLAAVFLVFKKTRKMGMTMAVSLFLGLLLGNICLKNLIARPRPCWVQEVEMLLSVPRDFSFPSCHTMASFEGAAGIWFYNRRWGALALLLAALIGFSRMYVFVHFPTDVLAGAVLGIGVAWLVFRWMERGKKG